MKKCVLAFFLCFVAGFSFATPSLEEGEEVRIYTRVELFDSDESGKKGKSLGFPEMMEGGIKANVLEVRETAELAGEAGNWCRLTLRLGQWNEDSAWIPKGSECWAFIPEGAKIFRK